MWTMTQANLRTCAGYMTLEDFIEKHKGVRRTVLAVCMLWVSAVICGGLYVMWHRGLESPETTFLIAVIGLMQAPVAFYFYDRGKR